MERLAEREIRLEQLLPLIEETLQKGNTVEFLPRGISMLPMLRQGKDTVILSPVTRELRKYDLPLYRRDDGAFVLHRIVEIGDTLACIGDNQYDLERGIRREQVIGVVTAFTREGKTVSVSDLRYRLYCCIWHRSRPFRCFLRRSRSFLVGKWRRIRG